MNEQHDTTHTVGSVNPLLQPIEWQGQWYYTTHYFHQSYMRHRAEDGKKITHRRHDNFLRLIREMPLYHTLITKGDIVELDPPMPRESCPQNLRALFRAVQWHRLVLLNGTAQAELTHHLDDSTSKTMAYIQNTHVAAPKAIDAYPELKAIVELVESVAAARKVAEAAQREAAQATAKADLALQQQQWLTIREYVYLHKLTHQFPEQLWSTFGRYLTGYCLEHNIPIRRQPIAGKGYEMEQAYHVEVMAQLLPPWLTRKHGQISLTHIPGGA